MRVDIWSDTRCPFCYIGKRKFEKALEQFPHRDKVELNWHSFELDPEMKSQPDKSTYDHLAESKGLARGQSIQLHRQVAQTAKEVGLTFNFEKTVVANSFDAHRLIQFAKKQGLSDEAEEILFKAHFTDGKDISDHVTLTHLGMEIGLKAAEIQEMLAGDAFTQEVRNDEAIANSIGVRGVPFFVINEQFSISGAQDPGTFLKALDQAWKEYEKTAPLESLNTAEGKETKN